MVDAAHPALADEKRQLELEVIRLRARVTELETALARLERIGHAVKDPYTDDSWDFDDRTDADWSDTGWVPVYIMREADRG